MPNRKYSALSAVIMHDAVHALLLGKSYDSGYDIFTDNEDEFLAFAGEESGSLPDIELGSIELDVAMQFPDREKWLEAMQKEIDKLTKLNTWQVVDSLPLGRKAIGHKWVLRKKKIIYF
jgi:hypothetical protein